VYRRYAIVSDGDLRDAALELADDAVRGHNYGHSSQPPVDTRSASTQNS